MRLLLIAAVVLGVGALAGCGSSSSPASPPDLTTVDASGKAGDFTSVTIGKDGLGLISEWDVDTGSLLVAHCANTACTGPAEITRLDVGGIHGYTSATTGTDGFGLISYFHEQNRDFLKVAHCKNAACNDATTSTIDAKGAVGPFSSVTIGKDGLGLISYWDVTDKGALKVAHCSDAACSKATTATLDTPGGAHGWTSATIGADGLGLISYHDGQKGALKIAHCADAACTHATTATLDATGRVGDFTSVKVGKDGLGLVSYMDFSHGDLKVAHCTDAACSAPPELTTLDSAGEVGAYSSLAIGTDGFGLISYHDGTNGDLKVAHCTNTACRAATP